MQGTTYENGTRALMEESKARLKSTLNNAYETQEMAIDTIQEVDRQGEQIRRARETVVDINNNLNLGDRYLRSVESWFGQIWNGWTSPKVEKLPKGSTLAPTNININNNYVKKPVPQNPNTDINNFYTSNQTQKTPNGMNNDPFLAYIKTENDLVPNKNTSDNDEVDQYFKETDSTLDELSNVVSNLKGMATGLHSSITSQNNELDLLSTEVDHARDRTAYSTHRTKRLL